MRELLSGVFKWALVLCINHTKNEDEAALQINISLSRKQSMLFDGRYHWSYGCIYASGRSNERVRMRLNWTMTR